MNLPVFLFVLVPAALCQQGQDVDCDDACPECPASPSEDAVSCDSLMSKMKDIDSALSLAGCDSSPDSLVEAVDEATCDIVAKKAIPACMVQEGDAKEKCLKTASEQIRQEKSQPNTDIMKDCKCQAFHQIRDSLMSVTELVCPSERTPKNWFPNSRQIWFNHARCFYPPRICNWWRQHASVMPKVRKGCMFCTMQFQGGLFN